MRRPARPVVHIRAGDRWVWMFWRNCERQGNTEYFAETWTITNFTWVALKLLDVSKLIKMTSYVSRWIQMRMYWELTKNVGDWQTRRDHVVLCSACRIQKFNVQNLGITSWNEAVFSPYWLYSPCGPWPLISLLIYSQLVALLGRVISPSQGRYLNTGQHKHRINTYTTH
jgi:hypothetical protein